MGTGLRTWLARSGPFCGNRCLRLRYLRIRRVTVASLICASRSLDLRGQMHTPKGSQVLGGTQQNRREPLCADVIQAFPDYQDDLLNR